jgi:hypothetical protein
MKRKSDTKFPNNGKVTDIVKEGSLLHLLFSGFGPQSEGVYYDMKSAGSAYVNYIGVISWQGCHVFAKCNNNQCHICDKYKAIGMSCISHLTLI